MSLSPAVESASSSTLLPTSTSVSSSSTSSSGSASSGSLLLMVRVENPPVQDAELQVHILLRGHEGHIIPTQSCTVRFAWYRSRSKRTCHNPTCISTTTAATTTTTAAGTANAAAAVAAASGNNNGGNNTSNRVGVIQDLVTLNRFCSTACFKIAFLASQRRVQGKRHPMTFIRPVATSSSSGSLNSTTNGKSSSSNDQNEDFGIHQEWNIAPFFVDQTSEDEWEDIGSSDLNFIPRKADVGHVLKLECTVTPPEGGGSPKQHQSLSQVVYSSIVIGSPSNLIKRKLVFSPSALARLPAQQQQQKGDSIVINPNKHAIVSGGNPTFRVVTYNILADIYATAQMFPYSPTWALSWHYRKSLILRELISFEADVICLQEVQFDHFEKFLAPELGKIGYEYVYKAKTRRGKVDGCAILFLSSKFTLVEKHEVEFNVVAQAMAAQGMFMQRELALQRLSRDNVGLAVILETKPATFYQKGITSHQQVDYICIGNVHCFWDPEFPDVKLWQTSVFLQDLEALLENSRYSQVRGARIPLVLSGDFNSVPGSSVVELIQHESVHHEHPDLASDKIGILPEPANLTHSLHLSSAHAAVTKTEPQFTNYTQHFVGVLDYIWFSRDNLEAIAALSVPPESVVRGEDNIPCPNAQFPSDHIALCCDIALLPISYQQQQTDARWFLGMQ